MCGFGIGIKFFVSFLVYHIAEEERASCFIFLYIFYVCFRVCSRSNASSSGCFGLVCDLGSVIVAICTTWF